MIAEKKKQLQTLAALVVLLGLAATYSYMSLHKSSTEAPVSPAEKVARVSTLPAANARIRVDLISDISENSTVGRRNVFQYYVPPPPPKPTPPPQPVVTQQPPARAITPPVVVQQPPPSALSSFKYDGIGIPAKPEKPKASISDGQGNHYNVAEGEFIMGRYRVIRVTETNVEIEDLDQNRRQTYTRVTQL